MGEEELRAAAGACGTEREGDARGRDASGGGRDASGGGRMRERGREDAGERD